MTKAWGHKRYEWACGPFQVFVGSQVPAGDRKE